MKSKKKKSIDASCLILGFTGSPGSGCTFLSEGIVEILSGQGHYYRLSEVLNKIAEERGLEQTISNLQNIGNELRGKVQTDGKQNLSFLIAACIQKIETDIEKVDFTEDENTVILIDGIKNEGEVKYLKQFPNF